MRRSIIAASAAAIASFAGYGSALAQGVEVYVGPPAPYYYSPGPYVQYGYAPPAYGYYGYAEPGVVCILEAGCVAAVTNAGMATTALICAHSAVASRKS